MAHYLRYLATDSRGIALADLQEAVQVLDPACRIDEERGVGRLRCGEATFARIELGVPHEPFFEEEIADLKAALEVVPIDDRKTVRRVMKDATALAVLRVVWEGRDTESTMERINPLCRWLLEHRTGLLQVDDEGYYGPAGLVLEVKTDASL